MKQSIFAGTQQTGGSSTDLEAVVPADELDAEYVQVVVELVEALGGFRRVQALGSSPSATYTKISALYQAHISKQSKPSI